jgi:hypothetical protein
MNRAADSRRDFTPKQGQYLAFIHAYTLVNGRPPAEADLMRFFRVTPPTVHQMVLNLEKAGADLTQAGRPAEYRGPARSIRPARTKSAACSTGQNHCDGVLVQDVISAVVAVERCDPYQPLRGFNALQVVVMAQG